MFYMKTDTGKKRENNEDYICQKTFNEDSLFVVLDGIGGARSGEVASKLAAEKIIEYLCENIDSNDLTIEEKLKQAVKHADKVIYELNKTNKAYKDMGTTLSLLYIKDNVGWYINVGDTRIYEVFDNNITQITEDDTYVNALVRDNIITKKEANEHPDKHVLLKAVGVSKNVLFNVNKIDDIKNKRFLICTDGLTNMLSDEEIHKLIITAKSKEFICEALINEANKKGGADNISAMYIEV